MKRIMFGFLISFLTIIGAVSAEIVKGEVSDNKILSDNDIQKQKVQSVGNSGQQQIGDYNVIDNSGPKGSYGLVTEGQVEVYAEDSVFAGGDAGIYMGKGGKLNHKNIQAYGGYSAEEVKTLVEKNK